MSEVSAEPEKLRTHAANVEKVGQSLSQALEAAQAVSLPTDAFGKLCAFLPPLFVDSVETDGVDAIESAQTALGEDAGKLRSVADSFETVDASLDMGLVEVRKAGEGVPDETIFHPDSFEILNREMQWIAKFTPNG